MIAKEKAAFEKLREYALADALCPCCDQTETCLDGCTFAEDCPTEAERMVRAREALKV